MKEMCVERKRKAPCKRKTLGDKGQKSLKRGRGKERKMEREKDAKRATRKERDEKTVSNRNRKNSMKGGK